MVNSMRDQAEYLDKYPTVGGNWLFREGYGEFTMGVLFPEFRRAEAWRNNAINRIQEVYSDMIYPDGVEVQLTPHYHNGAIDLSKDVLKLARLNDANLPKNYVETLEKMFAVDMWAMNPSGFVPPFNDSMYEGSAYWLEKGIALYPNREDFRYIVSKGAEGKLPGKLSLLYPWAGWAIMRTGWDLKSLYMMLDCGPFGSGHQHEDKLSFVLNAYGSELIFDAGIYVYDTSGMREYVVSPRGHNVVHVDGVSQNRRGKFIDFSVAKSPANVVWKSSPGFDYVEASYGREPGEVWGPACLRNVVQTRRILFVKPNFWIVVDTMTPTDKASHLYESTFHVDAKDVNVDASTKAVSTSRTDLPNLTILPLASDGLGVRIVKGQLKPFVQGWKIADMYGTKPQIPAPTVYYSKRAAGQVVFVYLFAPSKPGQPSPVVSISPKTSPPGSVAATVLLASGETRDFLLASDGNVVFEGGAVEFTSETAPSGYRVDCSKSTDLRI